MPQFPGQQTLPCVFFPLFPVVSYLIVFSLMPQRYKLFFIPPNISPNFFQKKRQRLPFAVAF